VTLAIVLVLAYVIGSVPTSYIVAHRLTGRDIRDMGDGNPGMMNVWDNVGFRAAFVVGWGDAGKGMAAVGLAYLLGLDTAGAVAAALVAVMGHDYSIFLRLHGGNGMATAAGGILALVPLAAAPAITLAIVLWLVVGSRRFGGIVGLMIVPGLAYVLELDPTAITGVVLLESVAVLKVIKFEGFVSARSRLDQ
jgi:acyl phosphate:glycerol-3-phosphate acyltransferase